MSKLPAPARSDAYPRRAPSGETVGSVFRPDVQVNLTRVRLGGAGRSGDPWKSRREVSAMSAVADTSGHFFPNATVVAFSAGGVAELSSTAATNRYPR